MDSPGNELIVELRDQLAFHWTAQLRPRLAGLTDAEYFWQPAPGCWTIRREATGRRLSAPPGPDSPAPTGPLALGAGAWTIDFAVPAPVPPPVTTIAWRLGHLIAGVLGARAGAHFGAAPTDHFRHRYAGTAGAALDQLDAAYGAWDSGLAGLHVADLAAPIGPAEGPWADRSMLALILHVHREVIHHGAEIALLRDLYRRRDRLG